MASLDMCLLRVEQVAKRSRISWKHTSTRQNMLKLTQSALPVLDSWNQACDIWGLQCGGWGAGVRNASYTDRLSNGNLHLKSRIQVLKLFVRFALCRAHQWLARCSFRPLSSQRAVFSKHDTAMPEHIPCLRPYGKNMTCLWFITASAGFFLFESWTGLRGFCLFLVVKSTIDISIYDKIMFYLIIYCHLNYIWLKHVLPSIHHGSCWVLSAPVYVVQAVLNC